MKNMYTKENSVRLSAFFSILQDKEKYTFCIIDIFDKVVKEKKQQRLKKY